MGATEPPTLFLTGSESLYSKRIGRTLPVFKRNFREEIAVTKPYKGGRKDEKPWHFDNLTIHMISQYDTRISNGMEADDLMVIEQYTSFVSGNNNTIICTRDKDLRMCPGLHYGWRCGKQETFGPVEYDELGEIELDTSKSQPKIVGGGFLFFAAQLLTGDSVDNIPGLPRCGPVKAYDILKDCDSVDSALNAVRGAYREKLGEDYLTYLNEQATLLWMIRELDEKGEPVWFNL